MVLLAARPLASRAIIPTLPRLLVAFVIVLAVSACARAKPVSERNRLHPCANGEGPLDADCGTLKVFENRATRTGRQISLNIVVLPAISNNPLPDPLFFLAGGPGQGAAKMAKDIRDLFSRIQRNRDIVLVDQRGTGKSNPLECKDDDDTLRGLNEPPEAGIARLKKCLAGYDADVTLYTTPIAMDDLDDVRAYLGYDRINLYGGSYGTRAALVYMRRHGDHVRAVVLDSVAPTYMRLPLYTSRDAQRALDKLVTDCEADARCHAAYPGFGDRVRALMQRVTASPVHTRLVHPRTGVAEDVEIGPRFVASVIFGALYQPVTASILPTLLDRAEHNDFQGLLALAAAGGSDDNMSVGMQLSVLCAEDAPRVTDADIARETAKTLFGANLLTSEVRACDFWPRGHVDPSYYQPVVSDIPTLVLSGDLDPVTPPTWGKEVASHLSHAKHVEVPASGHGVIGTACGWSLVQTFIDRGSVDELDTSCVKDAHRPPFFLTPAGPDPTAASKASAP